MASLSGIIDSLNIKCQRDTVTIILFGKPVKYKAVFKRKVIYDTLLSYLCSLAFGYGGGQVDRINQSISTHVTKDGFSNVAQLIVDDKSNDE
ncbi:hypothetical protein ES703_58949 [subsurface metagenome]